MEIDRQAVVIRLGRVPGVKQPERGVTKNSQGPAIEGSDVTFYLHVPPCYRLCVGFFVDLSSYSNPSIPSGVPSSATNRTLMNPRSDSMGMLSNQARMWKLAGSCLVKGWSYVGMSLSPD